MNRYIDADALVKRLKHSPLFLGTNMQFKDGVVDLVEKQPAADVVEVVRCKDCIYYEANCCFNKQWDMESSQEIPTVREIDYCSYGERKEENDTKVL